MSDADMERTTAPLTGGDTDPDVAPPAPVAGELVDPLIGSIVDQRYLILSRIARGGMATVYAGRDERLDRPVAVKVMHPHLAESADLVARFRREARATARLTHPAIVAVYDQGVVNGSGYLVMELVNGQNLRQVLRQRGSFSVGEALEMTIEILTGLAVAHNSGLIHRDVKPENVLQTASGQLKVADFGLARAVSDVTAATTGSVLGTVAYLAPELITGGEADDRTDLYSVGIMLYELINGTPPYDGSTPIHIAYSHVHDEIPALSQKIEWMPSEVDTLIGCLAATKQDERPRNAGEAVGLVQTVRDHLPAAVLERRHDVEPTEVAPTTTVEGITATSALDYGRGTAALPTDAVARRSQSRRRRRMWGIIAALFLTLAAVGGSLAWYFLAGPGAYIPMPSVVGMKGPEAVAVLEEKGLKVKSGQAYHDTIPLDTVIETDPQPGDKIRRNGTAVVVISQGVHMVKVPNIVNQDREAGLAALKEAVLAVGEVTEAYSEDVPAGKVVSTSVEAGTTVRHDTPVNVVISKGRQPLEVPELVGKTNTEGAKLLADLGLIAQASSEFSDSVAKGNIISQDPAPATTLYKGDKVSFIVSRGPENIPVPNVSGLSMAAAKEKLSAAGFQVSVEKMAFGLNPNRVYSQRPGGGKVAKVGSTVILYYV